MVKISIVLPVYNAAASLVRCLDSVLAQCEPDWELLAVDDGSADGSAAILSAYAERDPRIRVWSVPNGGPSRARNLAIDHARGEYLCFVDADDYLAPDYTAALAAPFDDPDIGLVCSGYYEINRGQNAPAQVCFAGRQTGTLSPAELQESLFYGTCGLICGKMYQMDVIRDKQLRFNENLNLYEDLLFTMRYVLHIGQAAVIPKYLYYYDRRSFSSLSSRRDLSLLANSQLLNAEIRKYYHGADVERYTADRHWNALCSYSAAQAWSSTGFSAAVRAIKNAVDRYPVPSGVRHSRGGVCGFLLSHRLYHTYVIYSNTRHLLQNLRHSLRRSLHGAG